jgi:hypothetical protein
MLKNGSGLRAWGYGRALFFTAVWALSAASIAFAQDDARFIELIIRVDRGKLSLIQQHVRRGALPGYRTPQFRKGDWVVQAKDSANQLRRTLTIPDLRRASVRRRQLASPATLLVRLPYDRAIARLEVSRLSRSIEFENLQPIAHVPPDAVVPIASLTLTVP